MKGSKGLTISQVAKRLGVPGSTLRYWVRQGLFPNARRNNPYAKTSPIYIPEEDLENFLEERERWPVGEPNTSNGHSKKPLG